MDTRLPGTVERRRAGLYDGFVLN